MVQQSIVTHFVLAVFLRFIFQSVFHLFPVHNCFCSPSKSTSCDTEKQSTGNVIL